MAFTASSRTGHSRVTRRLASRAKLAVMAASPATAPSVRSGDRDRRSIGTVRRSRAILADGARTTIHVARFAADETDLRLAVLRRPQPLVEWCSTNGVENAVVGGFFTRPNGASGRPLGELRTRGIVRRSVPFDAPWDAVRACVHATRGEVSLARRDELPRHPRGDLLQAGPLLVRDGVSVTDGDDPEGFTAGAAQFDSDITDGRYPRTAFAITEMEYLAVAVDGRARHDVGMTMTELANHLVAMGAIAAINLDGGGSSSLVVDGELCNVPRGDYDVPEPGGRPVVTALTFVPRV
jgi:hypothetical protein